MANNNDTKVKLKALSTKGTGPVMIDALRLLDTEMGEPAGTDIEYASIVMGLIKRLKADYKRKLLPQVKIYNQDLETEIKRVKAEMEGYDQKK